MMVLNKNICTPIERGTPAGKAKSEGKNACPKDIDMNRFSTTAMTTPGAPTKVSAMQLTLPLLSVGDKPVPL